MMKKGFAVLLGTVVSFAANAVSYDEYARVISVQEKYSQGSSRRVCDREPGSSSGNNIGAGTALGAVAGGLLGAQVGKGNGRVATAAGGAVVGALSGNYIENRNTQTSGETRCHYEESGGGRPVGYLVTYEYDGRTYTESFTYPPEGNTVRVRVTVTPLPTYRK
jgi:uncharacterized protein YcfJ